MTTTNRTLQFLGAAYGNSNVTVTATIDNVVVFNSTVATLDQEAPDTADVTKPMPVLFSVENSDQFPVDFAGSKSMSVAVSGGDCVILDAVLSNYILNYTFDKVAQLTNATINGTTLTFDSSTGNVDVGLVLLGNVISQGTYITAGSDKIWTVSTSQTVGPTTVDAGKWIEETGNATGFITCYNGTPTNSEDTMDCRSSVAIDGNVQVPDLAPKSQGTWTWQVDNGSTLTCNLNVRLGNVG
jgi:hypothetical protein